MVTTCSQLSPLGCVGSRCTYSVMLACSLYGTPFLRRYPSRKLVVTIFRSPPRLICASCRGGGPPRRPPPPPPGSSRASRPPPVTRGSGRPSLVAPPLPTPGPSHVANEKPCSVRSAGACFVRSKLSSRVCVPASN